MQLKLGGGFKVLCNRANLKLADQEAKGVGFLVHDQCTQRNLVVNSHQYKHRVPVSLLFNCSSKNLVTVWAQVSYPRIFLAHFCHLLQSLVRLKTTSQSNLIPDHRNVTKNSNTLSGGEKQPSKRHCVSFHWQELYCLSFPAFPPVTRIGAESEAELTRIHKVTGTDEAVSSRVTSFSFNWCKAGSAEQSYEPFKAQIMRVESFYDITLCPGLLLHGNKINQKWGEGGWAWEKDKESNTRGGLA